MLRLTNLFVDQIQKAMMSTKEKTKILDKAKMKEQVLDVVRVHPDMVPKLGNHASVPQFVKQKLKAWDGVRNLILEGSVRVDDMSEHDIPLVIIVHGHMPAIPPICYVTGDLYIPQWDPARSTLNTVIATILMEFQQRSFISSGHLEACGGQVTGLILSHDADFDWASFEAARQAQGPARPPPRTKRAPLFQVTDDTPASFVCPISLEVMSDPVTAADGHTYERDEIEDWFFAHSTSPLTNQELPSKDLEPHSMLQKQIHDYHRQIDPKYRERYLVF